MTVWVTEFLGAAQALGYLFDVFTTSKISLLSSSTF